MKDASFAATRSGASGLSVSSPESSTKWDRWISFASTMMVLTGCFQIIQGLVAVVNDDYLARSDGLAVDVNYTVWGWTWMLLGALVIAASVGVLLGQVWARAVGVVLAGVSALANFTFLAAYPVWSIVVIVLDVFIIRALTVHGDVGERA